MLDVKNTHWAKDGEQQTFLFPSVSEGRKKKKRVVSCQTGSELDEIFGELRTKNHHTPQPPKCFGFEWNILFDVKW